MTDELCLLHKIINYRFNDLSVARTAFTHASYSADGNNERLELLGDSVVNLAVVQYLYQNWQNKSEGELSKIRAKAVSTQELSAATQRLQLQNFLLLGKSEIKSQTKNTRTLANLFEALAGAIFVDGGFNNAAEFVLFAIKPRIDEIATAPMLADFKTALQEIVQSDKNMSLSYKLVSRSGTDHSPVFCFQAIVNGQTAGEGCGQSKSEAQQAAAKDAYEKLTKHGGTN